VVVSLWACAEGGVSAAARVLHWLQPVFYGPADETMGKFRSILVGRGAVKRM